MANWCEFSMRVKGKLENVESFFNALTQNDTVWIGRGATASIKYVKNNIAIINGWCKWSIQSALIDNAISMREQDEVGKGIWYQPEINKVREFLTLFDACEKYHVNMELYSRRVEAEFEEHVKYENGIIVNECTKYTEIFDENSEEWVCTGGYKWSFDLAEVE